MKIAIPTKNKGGSEDTVAEHFGRCPTYTVFNEDGDVTEIINNISEHMGGYGLPPDLLKKHGVNVLLCKALGPRALDLCRQFGIDVYVYQAKTVKELFELWKNNKIKKANFDNICEEHKL